MTSFSADEVACIAAGVELAFTVTVANEGTMPEAGIVLHDTLDTGFARVLSLSDIEVDRATGPGPRPYSHPPLRSATGIGKPNRLSTDTISTFLRDAVEHSVEAPPASGAVAQRLPGRPPAIPHLLSGS